MNTIISTVIVLSSLGVLLATVLYFVAQKFKVFEDPRIDEITEILPGANCGGCGYAGCRAFAEALVKNEDISTLLCPVGGSNVMTKAAERLGKTAAIKDPLIAVVRCAGSCAVRAKTNMFEGAKSCLVMATTYSGDTGCSFGCLGLGDCAVSCTFDAIHINPETQLPEVDEEKCTACGSCVKACPKLIIELRKKGPKNRRIFVSCINKDKGGLAKRACGVACIGCIKCQKVCAFDAITIANNLSYIDHTKCRLCRKCVTECPTNAISELNFPPRKQDVKSE
jgi:Na+-translocating ferredoxin:NAD+ oxidoreductase RNF subunit RnfB